MRPEKCGLQVVRDYVSGCRNRSINNLLKEGEENVEKVFMKGNEAIAKLPCEQAVDFLPVTR